MSAVFGVRDIDYLQDILRIDPKIGYSTSGGTLCVWRFWDGKPANRAEVVLKKNSIELYVGEETKAYNDIMNIGNQDICIYLKHSKFEEAFRFFSLQAAEPVLRILSQKYFDEDKADIFESEELEQINEEDISATKPNETIPMSRDEVMELVNSAVAKALSEKTTGNESIRMDCKGEADKDTTPGMRLRKLKTSDDSETVRDKFEALLMKQGFKSINSFANACGISTPNVHTNLTGKYALSVDRAFVYANTLGVCVEDIFEIFYAEQIKANREAVNRINKFVERDVTEISDEDLLKEEFY